MTTLAAEQIDRFIGDGVVRLDDAFPRAIADEGRAILWRETGCDPAQPHRGTRPRFMAQPPLLPAVPLQLERHDGDYAPVVLAIKRALSTK